MNMPKFSFSTVGKKLKTIKNSISILDKKTEMTYHKQM
jgi:hypothetical protein